MIFKHNNEVKNKAEFNLLHGIINHPKCAKKLNIHYSPILHGCMNTGKGRAKFKNFRIILDSRFSSTIFMGRIIKRLYPEKDALMQWNTQAGNVTNNLKVEIDFTLPTLSATNVVTWKCHVIESAKGRYDMTLGQDVFT